MAEDRGRAAGRSASASSGPGAGPRAARGAAGPAARRGRSRQGRDLRGPRGAARRSRPDRAGAAAHRGGAQRRGAPGASRSTRTRGGWRPRGTSCWPRAPTDLRDVGRRVLRLLAGHARRGRRGVSGRMRSWSPRTWRLPRRPALDRTKVLRVLHGGGRRHLARGHPGALAGHPGGGRHGSARARVRGRHARRPRRHAGARCGSRPGEPRSRRPRAARSALAARRARDAAAAHAPGRTRDGVRIEVAANVGGLERRPRRPRRWAAEGVGLLRSEFLFLNRSQRAQRGRAVRGLRGDRAHAGARAPARDPGAGRGRRQAAAVPAAAARGEPLPGRARRCGCCWSGPRRAAHAAASDAARRAGGPRQRDAARWSRRSRSGAPRRRILEQERAALGVPPLPLGIMVEVPAAALLADAFAREADFFSIGTNDLTQYMLAMDRGHPGLAARVDGLDPAVLRLIAQTTRAAPGARALDRRVRGTCGRQPGRADPAGPGRDRAERERADRYPRSRRACARWTWASAARSPSARWPRLRGRGARAAAGSAGGRESA